LSNPTVKNHLRRLEDFFLVFKVHPYSKNIKRALLKAPKCYLFDWARVESPGHRFENFVAAQWTARLRLWQEKSGDEYSLFYVRNKQKQETDFLTLKNKKPWLLIETKLSDASIENHHFDFQKQLGEIPMVQVCRQPGVAGLQTKNGFRLSADRFLS
jgi:predicted AAA+ superfamily ATPase